MKLKICGMKYGDNITEVAKLFPDFMGFIFYPQSKRFVGDNFIMPEIHSSIKKVGVFVNDTIENIFDKAKTYGLNYVQLHGDESATFCFTLFQRLKPCKNYTGIIKAFGMDEQFDLSALNPFERSCDYFLFDTKTKEYGGSGKMFDWRVLERYKSSKQFFLSGGISIEEIKRQKATYTNNEVRQEVKRTDAYALDINSKFEINPGLKDIHKIKSLITSLRETK